MSDTLRFDAAALSHSGWRYPDNQDAVLLDGRIWQSPTLRPSQGRSRLLAAVADGVAFAPCADRASRLALQLLHADVQALGQLDAAAPRRIQRAASKQVIGTRCAGMATTLAALELSTTGARVVSVGDSRVYRYRDGALQQLSTDHTLAHRLLTRGELSAAELAHAGSLYDDLDSCLIATESESDFDIHASDHDLQADDVWLCCTDGITQALSDAALTDLLSQSGQPVAVVRGLVEKALGNRVSDDNLSAVVVRAFLPS